MRLKLSEMESAPVLRETVRLMADWIQDHAKTCHECPLDHDSDGCTEHPNCVQAIASWFLTEAEGLPWDGSSGSSTG